MCFTPIINVLAPPDIRDDFIKRYIALCHGTMKPVERHKLKLGRQDRTWVGEYRYWIWEEDDFRIYVSNIKGVGFEVPVNFSSARAMQAWERYEELMA